MNPTTGFRDARIETQTFSDGQIVRGDCLVWFPSLPKASIQLIAIDPPFFTQREQVGRGGVSASYQDTWKGGKRDYLNWLLARIRPMRELLKGQGSFLIHLDWHSVHAVKVALDDVFGEENFQNEIIWRYQTGGAGKRRFSRKHDNLLWYTRSDEWVFHPERIQVPRTEKSLLRARNPKGARIAFDDSYKNPEDVVFIPHLNPMSRERTGYPTQKPVELMELFVQALTEPGDTVADFFCGSGTTLAAAARLGRRWLGCDVSKEAVRIAQRRLQALSAPPD